MYDDDGNELLNYRTGIYHNDVIKQFIKEAEGLLGPLLYDRKHFRKDFPQNSVGVHIEGLTEDQATTLDHLERCINDKAIPEPKGLRW